MTTTTHTIATDGAEVTYDVHGPLPTADGQPPLLMIGQPMDASGFAALAAEFPDRTVVTYDPRGMGRSTRSDGQVGNDPEIQGGDVHAVIEAVGGPVDLFASSGGAVTALALVTAYSDDVRTLVAHEPPLVDVLPDAEATRRATVAFQQAYRDRGWGAGMAGFIAMSSWQGEFTDAYFAQPAPDPAQFGLPTEDDGSRDDPLMSDRSEAITSYRPDVAALQAAPTRIVLAHGEESADVMMGRAAKSVAALLGQEAVEFPSHHGGFAGENDPWPGQAKAFAVRLHEVLANQSK
ncbi:alpha/beta hydrolase [Ornithinimicrobium sp. F0845]|uniref:alpha/beta fold hydrolase n=1 Tax=Ornithinimicrobium sp. F0845 TaxID=2926412 RepID=UPI001FF3EB72|nr:alpha/beta hydrolase [Ornithinimicrobium sp. F0845]MCK0110559.1 alpha/beta hydrolase [Ornithinimicrobium sp. F0845]